MFSARLFTFLFQRDFMIDLQHPIVVLNQLLVSLNIIHIYIHHLALNIALYFSIINDIPFIFSLNITDYINKI